MPAANYDEQFTLYRAGRVDALWQFMGIPSPSIQAAHAERPLKVLPLPSGLIARLAERGWAAAELPPGAYGGMVERPIPTVAMGTSLGFHAGLAEEIVFAITSAICEHPERVWRIHEAAADFDPKLASHNPGGPLHPGAARYFASRR